LVLDYCFYVEGWSQLIRPFG